MVLFTYSSYIFTVTVKILSLSESSVKLYEFTVSYQICTCLPSVVLAYCVAQRYALSVLLFLRFVIDL